MKSDMENKEWAGEEMSLKRFTKNNPFTVPSGYFEEAGKRILSMVKLDDLNVNNPANGFTVPANYFDKLTADIQSRVNITTGAEHTGFAVPANYFEELPANITSRINRAVDATAGNNGFALPADYFDNLSANIQSRINIQVDAQAEHDGFALPAGYFDQLTDKIQRRINIETIAGADAGLSIPEGYFADLQQQITARIAVEEALEINKAEFTVPEGYFDQLNRDILNKTVNKEVAIRKTIVRKLFANNTFKYATAACLALIIGAGAFLRESGTQVVVPVVHQQTLLHNELANVPVEEIKDYLELNMDAGDPERLVEDDKQINTQALDEQLSDYIDVN